MGKKHFGKRARKKVKFEYAQGGFIPISMNARSLQAGEALIRHLKQSVKNV